MKKSVCFVAGFLGAVLISGALSYNTQKISHIIYEKPVNKTVSFSVFAGSTYTAPLYKSSKARIVLTIYKFHDGKRELLWEEVINKRPLNYFPRPSDPLFREICVYNVHDRKEIITAYYKVIYESKGSEFSYEHGISLSRGSRKDSLRISI